MRLEEIEKRVNSEEFSKELQKLRKRGLTIDWGRRRRGMYGWVGRTHNGCNISAQFCERYSRRGNSRMTLRVWWW